ncbi:transcription factor 7-like 2 isoform X2 [Mytilus galloprovincialis]|uniref:transcription factor 7-like 2 isoform X2 n=1 Tax=Mytilus galloprovincialis TaxID=29158 RepID=UPI003F7BD86E
MTMPHVNSGGSEDFFSNDEVKVYKDEGEEEKRSSENLSEDKLGLVTETEEGKNGGLGNGYDGDKTENGREDGKPPVQDRNAGPFGYGMPSYPPYSNGSPGLGSKFQPPLAGLMMYNNDHFAQPPPAHMGIPPVHIDPKSGLPRPPVYPYPGSGQFPPSLYGPDIPVQWQRPPGYPITSGAFSGPYPPSLSSSSFRFGPPGLFHPHHGLHHPGMPHPALMSPGPKQEPQDNHRNMHDQGPPEETAAQKKKNHIKKPLNAFMLFMKEQRAKVVAECTLKESAAINQILGRKWHALDRSEQAKYYEMARKEKELHLQLYPGWSARDNYAVHTKKKRKKKDIHGGEKDMWVSDCSSAKKCRARYGVEQQNQWCKPCRRKKKCIRYLMGDEGGETDGDEGHISDSNRTGSLHDSDSMTGSPMHSVTSDDAFSTPSKSFYRHSPSPLGVGNSDLDFTLKSDHTHIDIESGEIDVCSQDNDLNMTLTSSPLKSSPYRNHIPVT